MNEVDQLYDEIKIITDECNTLRRQLDVAMKALEKRIYDSDGYEDKLVMDALAEIAKLRKGEKNG